MKYLYLIRLALLPVIFAVLSITNTFAQPAGATFYNPVDAGTLGPGSVYTDTKNNSPQYGFQNNMGQPSDDIYYRFTITEPAEITMALCGSNFDTYIYLLDANGNILTSNDDDGGCDYYYDSGLQLQLTAGTYYVVAEGWYSSSGNITTTISVPGESEGETPDAFYNKITQVFAHVNPSEVTTGLLLDAGLELVNMDNFRANTSLHDSNYVDQTTWRSIYGSLASATFNTFISFLSFEDLNNRVDSALGQSMPVPFLLLNYNYQAYRSDAISAGLVQVINEQIYDVSGRTQSPYETRTAFAIAPARSVITAPGGYASFVFKPELMFGNTGKTIAHLQVDFGNGQGLQNLTPGTAYTLHYSESGIKELYYQVSYTDNSTYSGHSRIYIAFENENETPGGNSNLFFHPIADEQIIASTPSGNRTATLQIRLSNQNATNTIRKPLIVAEGIDFWKIANSQNYIANDFIKSHLTEVNLFGGGNLRDSIDLLSYDIVFIDFNDATDYLENNSKLVQAAITWVNSHKQPLNGVMQQNVVMGLSMGGVLARHALRSMEINGISHDTKLYISVDSPHQGANFPLGLQALVKHMNNAKIKVLGGTVFSFKKLYPGIDIGKSILDAPACRQLLKYRIGDNSNLAVDNTEHDAFYQNYHALGMPGCRSIAISNGSECGQTQPFGPLQTIFEQYSNDPIAKSGGLQALVNIIDFVTAGDQTFLGALTNKPFIGLGALLGLFSTRTSFYVDFYAKTLPDHQNLRIYRGRAGIRRRILWSFNVNSNITNRSAYSASYMLPLDYAPGGMTTFSNGGGLGLPNRPL